MTSPLHLDQIPQSHFLPTAACGRRPWCLRRRHRHPTVCGAKHSVERLDMMRRPDLLCRLPHIPEECQLADGLKRGEKGLRRTFICVKNPPFGDMQ